MKSLIPEAEQFFVSWLKDRPFHTLEDTEKRVMMELYKKFLESDKLTYHQDSQPLATTEE